MTQTIAILVALLVVFVMIGVGVLAWALREAQRQQKDWLDGD